MTRPHPLQDTLVESEYSRDEAEEVLARVLSVVDSTDHFITQITSVLEDVGTPHLTHIHIPHTYTHGCSLSSSRLSCCTLCDIHTYV